MKIIFIWLTMVAILFPTNTDARKNKLETDSLYLVETGIGNPVSIIFLHGVGSSSNMWLEHMKSLTSFHFIAPDFPGHGKSNHVQWTNIDEVTDWVAQLIKTKCTGKAHMVGLSLGGGVALNLLKKYPDLAEKVIIDGQSLKPIKGARFAVFGVSMISPFIHNNFIIKTVGGIIGVTKDNMANFKSDMKHVRSKSFRRAFKNANSINMPDDLSSLKSPVLFVSGEKESETMHETHRKYANEIPGSKCFYYLGKNHGWMAEDLQTHIDMCKYWFNDAPVPTKLVSCNPIAIK